MSLLRPKSLLTLRLSLRFACGGIALSMASTMAAQVQSLSLQQAVDYALQHRPELRASGSMILAAEKSKDQAGTIPNPRLLFRKEDFVDHTGLGASSQTYYEGSELLETSGKRAGRLAVARQDVAQAHLQSDALCRQIALSVRELYWNVAANQALANLYADDDAFFEQSIAYHEARFREGKLAEVDLLRVQLQGQQVHAAALKARLDSDRLAL